MNEPRVATEQELVLLRTIDLMTRIESTDASVETDIEFAEMMAREWE